jgi:hypothetical protein
VVTQRLLVRFDLRQQAPDLGKLLVKIIPPMREEQCDQAPPAGTSADGRAMTPSFPSWSPPLARVRVPWGSRTLCLQILSRCYSRLPNKESSMVNMLMKSR